MKITKITKLGKETIEISFWSIMKAVFIANIAIQAITVGLILILGLFLEFVGVW